MSYETELDLLRSEDFLGQHSGYNQSVVPDGRRGSCVEMSLSVDGFKSKFTLAMGYQHSDGAFLGSTYGSLRS